MKSITVLPALLLLLVPCSIQAQAASLPIEQVIVTGERTMPQMRTVIHDFVAASVAPSPLIGEIARWRIGICPRTDGLLPAARAAVTARVRAVARLVGAPVHDVPCTPNIEIAFTAQPQALLDGVRAKDPDMLGYHTGAPDKQLVTISRPIQAWYATATRDIRNMVSLDTQGRPGFGPRPAGPMASSAGLYGSTPTDRVEGSLLRTGLASEFATVYIIVDVTKTGGNSLNAIADYVSLLALSQIVPSNGCRGMSSIADLLTPGCDSGAKALTDTDTAFLRGVYEMDPGASLQTQRSMIAYKIEDSLGDGK